MKFDAIVGNPPYQETTSDTSRQATPLYNLFMENAIKINPHYVSMIMPARWFAGGMGLDDFRNRMMNDKHIKKIVDYVNAKDCFPQISISGGVCYLLWDKEYNGDCEFASNINGMQTSQTRPLNEFDVLIRYNEAVSIVRKIKDKNESYLAVLVSSISPFGLKTNVRGNPDESEVNNITLYSSSGKSYISRNDITKADVSLNSHKVMVSQTSAEHAGEPSSKGNYRVLTSSMTVIKPNEVCTHSYLTIGDFDNEKEPKNLLKYLKTKFVRLLLLQYLTSIHITKSTFSFVPLQDFTPNSDIDWSKSIAEIDRQLYAKYDLSEEEIQFIEKMIKPME